MNKKPLHFLPCLAAWGSAAIVTFTFFWLLSDILCNGGALISWDFLTTAPKNAGRAGGIAPILVSTLLIVGVAMMASLPLGLGTAILLAELSSSHKGFSRFVRRSLDILAGVPSIVFGLFGNALFCKALGMGFSILSGGLTLACMVLPLIIRSTEEGLRAVPKEYSLSAAALGLSRITFFWHILIPEATSGLTVGIILGFGRALAETAALIFTSGYVDRMPSSLLDSGRALSLHIFDLSMNVTGGDPNAYRSAFVLLILLLLIHNSATILTNFIFKKRISNHG